MITALNLLKSTPLALAALGAAPWLAAAAPAITRPPNIVYIMADDLGYGDIGPFGQKKIRTPNLDRMAQQGTCFMQFYPGAAVCAPTRCALMTGLHTGHGRVRNNHGEGGLSRVPLRPEDATVAEVLKRAGYATGVVGKWSLGEPETTGLPNKKGFDFWFGYLNQDLAEDYYPEKIWKNDREITLAGNVGGKRGQYTNDLMTDEALAFMTANRAQPFFLYMAYTIPHAVLTVPEDSLKEYAGVFPEDPLEKQKGRSKTPLLRATYAAMVTRLDREVGRVFAKLAELGLDDNTVVFFCSDNGATKNSGVAEFFNSSGPFRDYKASLYEGGIHTEMIARWPGKIAAGKRSDFAWAGWDFLPTAAALAGVTPPVGLDGISVVPALLGQATRREGHLYWEVPGKKEFAQAVRVGDLKAIHTALGGPIEVYDLRADPAEAHNIAAEQPAFVRRAEALFKSEHTPNPLWFVPGIDGPEPIARSSR
jgi:arylsulfatase A